MKRPHGAEWMNAPRYPPVISRPWVFRLLMGLLLRRRALLPPAAARRLQMALLASLVFACGWLLGRRG